MTQIEKNDIDDEMINLVYEAIEKYDSIYNDSLRDNVDDKRDEKYLLDLTKYIDNYCENCTDQEWKSLLDDYCIDDQENYIGEVRTNLNYAIEEKFRDSDLYDRRKMLEYFKKHIYKEKCNIKIKEWYIKEFPSDDLGYNLSDDATFSQLNELIESNSTESIFDLVGFECDTVIRERCFDKLAELTNQTYSDIYNKWVGKKEIEEEIEK